MLMKFGTGGRFTKMRAHSKTVTTGKHPHRMTVPGDDTAHCDKTGHTCAPVLS